MAIIRPIFNWVAQPGITPPGVSFTRNSTATCTDALGVIRTVPAGVLRDSYDPVSGAYLGKLIEEQRTNLLCYSAEFDKPGWTSGVAPTIVPFMAVAPDGTNTCYSVADTSPSGSANLKQDIALGGVSAPQDSTTAYCGSLQIRKTTGVGVLGILSVVFSGGTTVGSRLEVNTTTGEVRVNTVISGSAPPVGYGIKDYGSFWQVWVAVTNNSTNNSVRWNYTPAWHTVWGQSAADPTLQNAAMIWGAQLETGAFPTSYIPTTSAPCTRSADQCTLSLASLVDAQGNALFDTAQGTLFARFSFAGFKVDTTAQLILSLNDGTTANQAALGRTVVGGIYGTGKHGGVLVGALQTLNQSPALNTLYQAAQAFSPTGRSACLNGGAVVADATAFATSTNTVSIGSVANTNFLSGHFRQVALFNRRLSDADLQALTA
ncbi:MAG: hypothetical protein ACLGQW_00085 [Acidobacteriota bacterium]